MGVDFMKLKKIIALALTIAMLLSVVQVFAFSDVPENSKYKESIDLMAEKGIIKGHDDGTFGYDEICTRAQFITFLYRAAGEPDEGKPVEFTDVADGEYYKKAITWAYNNSIIKPFEDGSIGVDVTVDRSHAVTFLHQWAKVTGYGNLDAYCNLAEYADSTEIEHYALSSYCWAVGDGVITPDGDNKIYPKAEVTRSWTAEVVAKLISTHYHNWSEYKDNGNGTCQRVCTLDGTHIEKAEHNFNYGELTKKVTETEDGEITYTCVNCKLQKVETVKMGTEVTTRADMEDALVAAAWAYYVKGPAMQYDGSAMGRVNSYYGGKTRIFARSAPELATKHVNFYSVCSNYTNQIYNEALGIHAMGEVTQHQGLSTYDLYRVANNQFDIKPADAKIFEPKTENDVEAGVAWWFDFDEYKSKMKAARYNALVTSDSFNLGNLDDYTDGINYKADGFDGEVHYAYYDDDGNKLSPTDVRDNNMMAFVKDSENTMRPGDLFVTAYKTSGHSTFFAGNDLTLHCTGSAISLDPVTDKIEENGAIRADFGYMAQTLDKCHSVFIGRPLEFLLSESFDDDLGNDVAKITLSDKIKSRIKYPMMSIDRTVDITQFGTAVKGGNLTYTIEISNNTNDEKYLEWGVDYNKGEETYKGIVVTEKIPEGTQLVEDSVVGAGIFADGVITWNLEDIKPGEKVTLSYTVKVTAEVGETIVADGGMVDNIPSNSISNTVGAEKLSKAEAETLEKIAEGDLEQFGTDTDFAEGIYKAMGKELDIPSAKDIADILFTVEAHVPGSDEEVGGFTGEDNNPLNVYVRQTEIKDEHKPLKSMIVDRYWGGYSMYVGDDLQWEFSTSAIKDFRSDYLEKGDILVYMGNDKEDRGKTTFQNNPVTITVMVFDGSKLIATTTKNGETTYKVYDETEIDYQLLRAFDYEHDLFFNLRPSQLVK